MIRNAGYSRSSSSQIAGRLPGLSAVTTRRSGAVFCTDSRISGFLCHFPDDFDPRFFCEHLHKQLSHQLRLVRHENSEGLDHCYALLEIEYLSFGKKR